MPDLATSSCQSSSCGTSSIVRFAKPLTSKNQITNFSFRDQKSFPIILSFGNLGEIQLESLSAKLQIKLDEPETPPKSRFRGSSQGWLVVVELGPIIFLLNPLSSIQIQLPPVTTFPCVLDFDVQHIGEEYLVQLPGYADPSSKCMDNMRDLFITKIVLSSSPTSLNEDYVVVAIHNFFSPRLAYYYKGSVAICDLSGLSPLVTVIEPPLPNDAPQVGDALGIYLVVDSFGELLLVARFCFCGYDSECDSDVLRTYGFYVFKLDLSEPVWVEVESIGDHMLFVGRNSSLCLLATDFSGCDGNCIYFVDDYSELGAAYDFQPGIHDNGVYNIEDCSTKPLPSCTRKSRMLSASPIWVTPNPC
ncbi:Protein of unknown function DUF295 [Macleaya cordata]|uniref:KIB1-4 beta-propeller domain-containing protein n=1 Tax=Macleaya cordata TaxID=56857 RepID=A0A200QDP0_MACCD|nr:Protein of unknown function DUF295 [Macleaya cordata]